MTCNVSGTRGGDRNTKVLTQIRNDYGKQEATTLGGNLHPPPITEKAGIGHMTVHHYLL